MGDRRHKPPEGEISLLENWLRALAQIHWEKVIVCEDDDYYHPLTRTMSAVG